MLETTDTMMNPGVEEPSKAPVRSSPWWPSHRRARGINTYYSLLGAAMSHGVVPPQVTSRAHKPLSIAFEEIAADKIEGVGGATGKPIPEELLPEPEADSSEVFGAQGDEAESEKD
ncbi:MAG: DNA-directed RNA polymerase subunit omega [Microthrixaceae bacterium]